MAFVTSCSTSITSSLRRSTLLSTSASTSTFCSSIRRQTIHSPRKHFRASPIPLAMVNKGDTIPSDVELMQLQDGKPTPVKAGTIFSGKTVAFFTLPGALTPTCQDSHVVDWLAAVDDLKAKGVDSIACISVNDPFVMSVFEKKTEATGKIDFYADGAAEFTKAIGVDFDTGGFGGVRAMRASYLVENGEFKQVNIEPGKGAYEGPAKPDTVLSQL